MAKTATHAENNLIAQVRTRTGKGASRQARRDGLVPAVLYGHGTDPQHLVLPAREFAAVLRNFGTNAVLTLDVDGKEALALVKASAVVLVADFAGWQLSARNQLAGTVSRIDRSTVSALVVLTLPGGMALSATITHDALEALGLDVGAPASAVFKAYSVMVATQP